MESARVQESIWSCSHGLTRAFVADTAPILGDTKYSDKETRTDNRKDPRIYLHMGELELKVTFWTSLLVRCAHQGIIGR